MAINDSKSATQTFDDAVLLRLPQVLRVIPVGRSSWWKGVSEGRFPRPVRIGPRTVAWRAVDIRALIERIASQEKAV